MNITVIAAVGLNRALGKDNKLLWDIPEDMKLFKLNTTGKTVVMGRNTAISIGRALPRRRNLVLTSGEAPFEGVTVVRSLAEAIQLAGEEELCVIGGARLYEAALPLATHLKITHVVDEPVADVFFPTFKPHPKHWQLVEEILGPETDTHPPFIYRHHALICRDIDFSQLREGQQIFAYRQAGELWRKSLEIDHPRYKNIRWAVSIPDGTYSISSGFFLGLFGPSIRAAGSREAFLSQFEFMPTAYPIQDNLEKWIDVALNTPRPL